MSRIEAQVPQGDVQEGQRLMIVELRKYNEVRELLIGIETTGLWGHVCYWDGGCPHGEKGDMGANIHRGAYSWSLSQE